MISNWHGRGEHGKGVYEHLQLDDLVPVDDIAGQGERVDVESVHIATLGAQVEPAALEGKVAVGDALLCKLERVHNLGLLADGAQAPQVQAVVRADCDQAALVDHEQDLQHGVLGHMAHADVDAGATEAVAKEKKRKAISDGTKGLRQPKRLTLATIHSWCRWPTGAGLDRRRSRSAGGGSHDGQSGRRRREQ